MYTLTLSRMIAYGRRSLSYFYYIIFEKGFLRRNVTGYRYTYIRGICGTFTLYVHTCILRAHIVTGYTCTLYIYFYAVYRV